MEPKGTLLSYQQDATGPILRTYFTKISSHTPIYVLVIQVDSALQGFQPKFCICVFCAAFC